MLVQVKAVALNPGDYKVTEVPVLRWFCKVTPRIQYSAPCSKPCMPSFDCTTLTISFFALGTGQGRWAGLQVIVFLLKYCNSDPVAVGVHVITRESHDALFEIMWPLDAPRLVALFSPLHTRRKGLFSMPQRCSGTRGEQSDGIQGRRQDLWRSRGEESPTVHGQTCLFYLSIANSCTL
jgi:hypothetical protein